MKVENLILETSGKVKACPILMDFCLSIRKKRVTALIGESGAGKTVLGKTLSALLPENIHVTSGRFFYQGKRVDDSWLKGARGQTVFYAPQNAAASFNPVIRIGKQIKEAAGLSLEKLYENLELLQVKDCRRLLDSYPFQLSEGENQRALLAMALAVNSEILILDEPTSALDTRSQRSFERILDKARSGSGILLITHNLRLALDISDYIYIIQNGVIVEQAETPVLFKNPVHEYTRELARYLDT